jgi:hypothetical protein
MRCGHNSSAYQNPFDGRSGADFTLASKPADITPYRSILLTLALDTATRDTMIVPWLKGHGLN